VFWLFWTPLFFTISKNILHTYTLPVTIPIALLMVHWWKNYEKKNTMLAVGSIFPAVAILLFFGAFLTGKLDFYMNSDKYLIENQQINFNDNEVLYYWKVKSYSGQFYSNGKAKTIADAKEMDSILRSDAKLYFVVLNKKKKDIPSEYQSKMELLDSNFKSSIYLLKPE
jgi:hypothetical protein